MSLSTEQEYLFFASIFMAVFGIIGVYNLFLYFVIRRSVYLYYCTMIAGLVLHASNYLIHWNHQEFTEGFSIISAGLTLLGSLLFTRSFLNLDKPQYGFWKKIYKILIICCLVIILAQLFNMIFGSNVRIEDFLSILIASLALIAVIIQFATGISLWYLEPSAKNYIMTCAVLLIGAIAYIIQWFLVGDQLSSQSISSVTYIFFSSVTVQMVLFSIVIGNNLRNLEYEKLDLQRDINQKLEIEVRKQTLSLIEAKDEINQQKNDLLASNKVKMKLFSLVSHDIRNPLATVLGLVDLLGQKGLTKKESGDIVVHLRTKLEEGINILNRVLTWSYAQLEGINLNKEQIDVGKLVNENLSLFEDRLVEKKLRINLNLQPGTILGDLEMIDTIIRNLILNSIKFSHEEKSISFDFYIDQNLGYMSIKDEGIGMDPNWFENLEKREASIIQPGTKGEKGHGFGLVISKDFAEMHDGKLLCESKIGFGTTFTLVLPTA